MVRLRGMQGMEGIYARDSTITPPPPPKKKKKKNTTNKKKKKEQTLNPANPINPNPVS